MDGLIWTSLDTWIVVIAALSAMSCALLGNYLVLRKMSMMGDAISHTVLPGLAAAFLVTGSRGNVAMFLGACVIGVLTALLVQTVRRFGNVDEGASMGVVFTSLFALGLILIRQAADYVDLDPGCVLYGAVELAPLDTLEISGWEIPRAALMGAVMLLLNGGFVALFYKELKITSFDPELATSLGIRSGVMHYLLMTFVAMTTVAAFEAVGSILVIAMLIVPGACASLLTHRLSHMLLLSLAIAGACAAFGHLLAITAPGWFGFTDTSTAGSMGVAAGLVFFGVFLLAPRQGILSRAAGRLAMSLRIARQDILAALYRRQEMTPAQALALAPPPAVTASPWLKRLSYTSLLRGGLIRREGEDFALTPEGESRARRLIRSHRLWESYLVDQAEFRPDHTHPAAEKLEHFTDSQLRHRLESETGSPAVDPQGKEIPTGGSPGS